MTRATLLMVFASGCSDPDTSAGKVDTGSTNPADSTGDSTPADDSMPDTAMDSGDSEDTVETADTADTVDTASDDGIAVASVSTAVVRGARRWATDASGVASVEAGIGRPCDFDGDGVVDLALGFPGEDDGSGAEAGGAFLFRGPILGDLSTATADGQMFGVESGEHAGYSVDAAGDVNGDGVEDLIVGAPGGPSGGQAYVLNGPIDGNRSLRDADATLLPDEVQWTGYFVIGAGNLDGDGFDDVVVGAAQNGDEVLVVGGPMVGTIDMSTGATARITGGNLLGEAGASEGDLDGDGLDDLLLSIDSDVGIGLFAGPFVGDLASTDADATYTLPPWSGCCPYTKVAVVGDTNGDGFSDILVSDVDDATAGAYAGAAYLALGPVSGTHELAVADGRVYGEANDYFGTSIAGIPDINGDGRAEVAVAGAPGDGAVLVFSGGFSGTATSADASRVLVGSGSELLGDTLRGTEDVDGDGIPDLLISAPGESSLFEYNGAVYVVSGALLL